MSSKAMETLRGMKTFLVIWGGQLISIIGSGLTGFALSVSRQLRVRWRTATTAG
jgi:hypothetical protein